MGESNVNWAEMPASQYPFLMDKERTSHKWNKERIYRDRKTGNLYHKDGLHGEIEAYNRRGNHIGVLTPEGDKHPIKGAVPGRRISI
ncbi:Cytotoxic [compost metagenome]